MKRLPHKCDDKCICPIHETQLVYWPAGNEHACQNSKCMYARGLERFERSVRNET